MYAENGRLGKGDFIGVLMQFEFIANNCREQHGFAKRMKGRDEVVRVDFIGQRMVKENCLVAILLFNSIKQYADDFSTHRAKFLDGMLFFSFAN